MAIYNVPITISDSAGKLLEAYAAGAMGGALGYLILNLQVHADSLVAGVIADIRSQMKGKLDNASADDLVFALQQGPVPKV